MPVSQKLGVVYSPSTIDNPVIGDYSTYSSMPGVIYSKPTSIDSASTYANEHSVPPGHFLVSIPRGGQKASRTIL